MRLRLGLGGVVRLFCEGDAGAPSAAAFLLRPVRHSASLATSLCFQPSLPGCARVRPFGPVCPWRASVSLLPLWDTGISGGRGVAPGQPHGPLSQAPAAFPALGKCRARLADIPHCHEAVHSALGHPSLGIAHRRSICPPERRRGPESQARLQGHVGLLRCSLVGVTGSLGSSQTTASPGCRADLSSSRAGLWKTSGWMP